MGEYTNEPFAQTVSEFCGKRPDNTMVRHTHCGWRTLTTLQFDGHAHKLICLREIVIVITKRREEWMMPEASATVRVGEIGDRVRYDALMDVVVNRITTRAFRADYVVPREH